VPLPGVSFVEEETATPVRGFPILLSARFEELRGALERFLVAEEEVQTAVVARTEVPRQRYGPAWERYRYLLAKAVENSTISSYGRNFPAIFWLQHSLDVARLLKETPRRVTRLDLEIGRRHGDSIKYRVLERFLDRVLSETYDAVRRVADDTDDIEDELFPRILTRMRDNVLLFSEDHISPDLGELGSYFQGYLRLDGRDLLRRLQRLGEWSAEKLADDQPLREVVRHLLVAAPLASAAATPDPESRARELLTRPGWVRYLSQRPDYPANQLLPPPLVKVWEGLLIKLKEFELIHGLRRYLLPVRREGNALVCRAGATTRTLEGRSEMRLSNATRPLDFMAPWVVDPQVDRFGLIYDLSDFSDIVSVLRRSGTDVQDDSFRKMFRFQRRLNRLATGFRMKLEKYLGDGAFYSSRYAGGILTGALQLQRAYRQALEEGFPFDRGMRLALNYGQYRLIPIGAGRPGDPDRYEFFGHGLVELSRLITGKASREIEEIKTLLVAQGYPEATVYRFFSPLLKRNLDTAAERPGGRTYFATINSQGNLVNEGIVATEAYVSQLGRVLPPAAQLARFDDGDHGFVVVTVEEGGDPARAGMRKMGLVQLKGLDRVPVYEVVDASIWDETRFEPATGSLMEALEREYTMSRSRAEGEVTRPGVA
jgi:hypothetical protein